jgi:EAL and modified HD-GYP domain-containing signal transduction protein
MNVLQANQPSGPQLCFLTRQPIFDADHQVFGYELLFRPGEQKGLEGPDGDPATFVLLDGALSAFGFDCLTAGRTAFIPVTGEGLRQECSWLLPAERTVVEILGPIEPSPDVLDACDTLKRAGHLLALADVVSEPPSGPLLDRADFLKVDFQRAAPDRRRRYPATCSLRGAKLLAEKVETWEEWEEAQGLGYSYFQGTFFCKPDTLSSRAEVPGYKINGMRLLSELNRAELDFARVEQVIKQDYHLSLRLLSYLNSSLFGWRNRVTSIRHAAVLLGVRNLRKWAALATVSSICEGRPPELLLTCLLRARFCELLAGPAGVPRQELDLFLVGLFSSIDAILSRPVQEVLREFSVSKPVQDALLGVPSDLGRTYELVRAYERGDWLQVSERADGLRVSDADIVKAYRQAVQWANEAYGTAVSTGQ